MKNVVFVRMVILSLTISSCAFSLKASAQDFANVWDINRLSRSSDTSVILKNKKNTVLKTVSTSQLRLVSQVFSDISEVSEMSAKLILVEGNQPNAFAGL